MRAAREPYHAIYGRSKYKSLKWIPIRSAWARIMIVAQPSASLLNPLSGAVSWYRHR